MKGKSKCNVNHHNSDWQIVFLIFLSVNLWNVEMNLPSYSIPLLWCDKIFSISKIFFSENEKSKIIMVFQRP